MNKKNFLSIGILLSLFIHIFLAASIFHMSRSEFFAQEYEKSRFVKIKIPEPEPEPEPPPPPPPKKVEEKKPPVSHIKDEPEEIEEEVKPVFGVTEKTADEKETEGIEVRVGNTLMKEMEEEFTPPDQVKDYAAGKKLKETKPVKKEDRFNPTPILELSKLPIAIRPAKPAYPEPLEEQGIEGEVILRLYISKKGKVVKIEVVDSDHPLFTESAKKTVATYRFKPGETKNGTKVDAVIEFTIVFEMPF